MSTAKMDRRKQYTRMVLKESLMNLMQKKPISNITIKEICEGADINRSTYYSHYSDQHDLLNQIEEEIIQDMIQTLGTYNTDEETLQMTEKILEYIVANSDVCNTLFCENGDIAFQKRVMMIAHEHTVRHWQTTNNMDLQILEYISLFAVSGSIQVVQSWLKNDMDKSPKEMADIINRLTQKGLSSFV